MGLGLRGIVLINIMAKFRKMYAKKRRSYRKKRGFKKRRGNKMMISRNAIVKQVWTQSFFIVNQGTGPNLYCPFVIDLLGSNAPLPANTFYISGA